MLTSSEWADEPSNFDVLSVEVLVQRVLKKCSRVAEAESLFDSLSRAGRSGVLGHVFGDAEVAEASLQCASLLSRGEASFRVDRRSAAETLVDFVLRKYQVVNAVADFFRGLHRAGKQDDNQVTILYSTEEVIEARALCTMHFDESAAKALSSNAGGKPRTVGDARNERAPAPLAGSSGPTKAISGAAVNFGNVDLVVQHVLKTSTSMDMAEPLFEALYKTAGRVDTRTGGRGFRAEEIAAAWLRCAVCYDEQEAEATAPPGGYASDGEASAGSGTESSKLPRPPGAMEQKQRRPHRKAKAKTSAKKGRSARHPTERDGHDDMQDDRDGDDLSGEEEVDRHEDAVPGAVPVADLGVSARSDEEREDGYSSQAWKEESPEVTPGCQGFNKRATTVMRGQRVGTKKVTAMDDRNACPPLQPHQEAVAFLLHPKSPVTRFLVDHPTGSGKTREMIQVLDNYFYDPRPKVPIFPRDAVCRSFYAELLRWPSRYRDYFACERPSDAATACGSLDWRERRLHMWDLGECRQTVVRRLCHSIREVLEMKGMSYMGMMRRSFRADFRRRFPGEPMPLAPLRAISYTSAGGAFSAIVGDQPTSAIMKVGYEQGSQNVYTNKVVLLDEAHNLVRTQTRYAAQLERLRDLLVNARRVVLAGFTGTPILDQPEEGRWLLDIVKGVGALVGDEGFISSFTARPRALFAESLPEGVPDGLLTAQRLQQLVKRVELCGESLRAYDVKRRLGHDGQRLRNYCNVCVSAASFHQGKNSSKARILARPEDCCPKLHAVAQAVASSPEKALVLTGRTSGHAVMLELLRQVAATSKPPFGVATMEELAEFNGASNLRGQKYRVLVADAAQCSEGVSFLAVRHAHLTDVPTSPSHFAQQCGRALRMYGHRGLGEAEQTVITQLYVATFPRWMRSPLACWAVAAQSRHGSGRDVERRARLLTGRLKRAGIGHLQELKEQLDAHGGKARTLTPDSVIKFLEKHDLWEEVRLLRHAEQKAAERFENEKAQGDVALAEAFRVVKSAHSEVERCGASGRGRTWRAALCSDLKDVCQNGHVAAALRAAAPTLGSAIDEESAENFETCPGAVALGELKAFKDELLHLKAQGVSPVPQTHALVQALQALYATKSKDTTAWSPCHDTADEIALSQLARMTHEFAPALAELRAAAVDREIFAHLEDELDDGTQPEDADGEAGGAKATPWRRAMRAPATRGDDLVAMEARERRVTSAVANSTVTERRRRLRCKTPSAAAEPRITAPAVRRHSLQPLRARILGRSSCGAASRGSVGKRKLPTEASYIDGLSTMSTKVTRAGA